MNFKQSMKQRGLAGQQVSAIGLGCMGLSYGYGTPPGQDHAKRILLEALDIGYTHFDTATMYGAGANEELIGETIGDRRGEYFLASKCGLYPGRDTPRIIDGHPDRIKRACEDSLKRLRTDVIDLYYLHRLDRDVPIEDSVGAFAELVEEGKIRAIGLSEMSAETIRRAHKVHPIAALQTEYSLWSRNAEIAVRDLCDELGIAFVAFSPVGRGFLSGTLSQADLAALPPKDIRKHMPRFQSDLFNRNSQLLPSFKALADEIGCTMAQLSIAWVLAQGEHILAIPGTTDASHLKDNADASDVVLDSAVLARLDALINHSTVAGSRYSDAQQRDIDTEQFETSGAASA